MEFILSYVTFFKVFFLLLCYVYKLNKYCSLSCITFENRYLLNVKKIKKYTITQNTANIGQNLYFQMCKLMACLHRRRLSHVFQLYCLSDRTDQAPVFYQSCCLQRPPNILCNLHYMHLNITLSLFS